MKKIMTALLIISSTHLVYGQVEMSELETIGGLLYKVGENEPYTGKIEGNDLIFGEAKDGERIGEWLEKKAMNIETKYINTIMDFRDVDEREKLAKTRNCIVGSEWAWTDSNEPKIIQRFFRDGTFTQLVNMSGFQVATGGDWEILNEDTIYCEFTSSSIDVLGDPRIFQLNSCSTLTIDRTIFNRTDKNNSSETWDESYKFYEMAEFEFEDVYIESILGVIRKRTYSNNQIIDDKRFSEKPQQSISEYMDLISHKKYDENGFLIYEEKNGEVVYEIYKMATVEVKPIFPGCENLSNDEQYRCFQNGLIKHIRNNFQYPKTPKNSGVSEKIFVQFVIDEYGQIINPKIVRGVDKHLRADALRLVNSIPNLQPAEQKGHPVPCSFTIPINYKLQ